MNSDSTTKPFYRNTEDTLEDVGITRRQLSHWRKAGLFDPEFGPTTKYFTQGDTEHLQFLKRLIEDLKLPVAKVKELIASAEGKRKGKRGGLAKYATFIDIENMKLMLPADAANEMISTTISGARPAEIEKWFQVVAYRAFAARVAASKTPAVYEAHVKGFLDQLARTDLMARLYYDEFDPDVGGPTFYFSPARESDPTLTLEEVENLAGERQTLDRTIFAY